MPYDSEGNFTRDYNWDEDRQNDIDIASDRMDGEFDNYANGMNLAFLRDGRATMTGEMKMGNFQIRQVANGTVPTDAVNKGQLDETKTNAKKELLTILNMLWKIGDVKHSIQTANHGSWFLCNGQAISRVTYSALFAIIGTKFGAGDGTTTFNLPDYRGKFLRMLGGNSESDIYKTQEEAVPAINGKLTNVIVGNGFKATGAIKASGGGTNVSGSGVGWSSVTMEIDPSGKYKGEHVTPINQALNFFIKVAEEK